MVTSVWVFNMQFHQLVFMWLIYKPERIFGAYADKMQHRYMADSIWKSLEDISKWQFYEIRDKWTFYAYNMCYIEIKKVQLRLHELETEESIRIIHFWQINCCFSVLGGNTVMMDNYSGKSISNVWIFHLLPTDCRAFNGGKIKEMIFLSSDI